MKYISKIYKKFINIDNKKRQILFALFALCSYIVLYLITRSDNQYILKSAVPAAVAAGAKAVGAATTSTTAAGGAATASAAATGGTAAGGSAAASGVASGGTTATQTGNAVSNGVQNTANAAKNASSTPSKSAYKTTEINRNANTASSQNIRGADQIKNKPTELDDTTSKTSKKESSMSETEKSKKDSKKYRMDSQIDSEEDEIDDGIEEGSSEILGKNSSKNCLIGCLIGGPLIFLVFVIPILVTFIISPTSSVMSVVDCSTSTSNVCALSEKFFSFIEKAKNLVLFGEFEDNGQAIANKAVDVSNEIYDEKNVQIDIPLLVSSVLADVATDGQTDEITIDEKMKERIKYLNELGELQVISDSVIFICKSKVVDDVTVYYNELDYNNIDPETVVETECNESTEGEYVKETLSQLDIEGYYERLKENKDVLEIIYGEESVAEEKDLNLLIDKIRMQRDFFKSLYDDEDEEIGAGNVPLELFYDTNINLQTPLKGNYSITSFYGERTGIFSGFHKGIDVISNDKSIYSAGDGVVTKVYKEILGGNVIEISHTTTQGITYVTQYAHLSKFLVTKGDVVKSGEIIGIMGDTGNTSGVHLHFQMWDSTEQTYNPLNLFKDSTNYPS